MFTFVEKIGSDIFEPDRQVHKTSELLFYQNENWHKTVKKLERHLKQIDKCTKQANYFSIKIHVRIGIKLSKSLRHPEIINLLLLKCSLI